MTQRWFGVWTPPAAIPSPAFNRKGRSVAAISGAPCRRPIAAAVATLWTTNPVSGGELKFVVSRSMLP